MQIKLSNIFHSKFGSCAVRGKMFLVTIIRRSNSLIITQHIMQVLAAEAIFIHSFIQLKVSQVHFWNILEMKLLKLRLIAASIEIIIKSKESSRLFNWYPKTRFLIQRFTFKRQNLTFSSRFWAIYSLQSGIYIIKGD